VNFPFGQYEVAPSTAEPDLTVVFRPVIPVRVIGPASAAVIYGLLDTGADQTVLLTKGFSKLRDNHEAMIALFVAYYNFCRVHRTLLTTPAKAAGLTDHAWSVKELLDMISE